MSNETVFLFLRDRLNVSPPTARRLAIEFDSVIFGVLTFLLILTLLGGAR